jgi:hypothetical protein
MKTTIVFISTGGSKSGGSGKAYNKFASSSKLANLSAKDLKSAKRGGKLNGATGRAVKAHLRSKAEYLKNQGDKAGSKAYLAKLRAIS